MTVDIKAYISSGAIEACILGVGTPAEMAELDRLIREFPEVAEAKAALEADLEKIGDIFAVSPPAALKDQVLTAAFDSEAKPDAEDETESQNEPDDFWAEERAKEKREKLAREEREKRLREASPIRRFPFYSIAATILLLLSITANYYFYHRVESLKEENANLTYEVTEIARAKDNVNQTLAEIRQEQAKILEPAVTKVSLRGTDVSPTSGAAIFYNSEEGWIRLVWSDLPEPPPGKQYQLWALVDGNPVDLGVFEWKDIPQINYQRKQVRDAGAFAITLEDAGGVASPTLDQMYLLGEV